MSICSPTHNQWREVFIPEPNPAYSGMVINNADKTPHRSNAELDRRSKLLGSVRKGKRFRTIW